jgi:hypothetical protein
MSSSSQSRKEFNAFIRQHFTERLGRHGYRLTKPTNFERDRDQVVTRVTFLLSRDGRRFVPRFNVWLAPFYAQTGVMVLKDLSAIVHGAADSRWWRWPHGAAERDRVAREVLALLESEGLPWLLHHGQLPGLIEYLDSRKYRTSERAASLGGKGMEQGGITTLYSDAVGASIGGRSDHRVQPEVVQHLSYCYELQGRWEEALASWKEYCGVFPPSEGSEFSAGVKRRLEYLTTKAEGASSGSGGPLRRAP